MVSNVLIQSCVKIRQYTNIHTHVQCHTHIHTYTHTYTHTHTTYIHSFTVLPLQLKKEQVHLHPDLKFRTYLSDNGDHTNISIHIHSFIHSGHFYSAPSSLLLHGGAPDYSTDTVSEFHAEAHGQLQVKDLPKVLTWRLERESNPRPSGWKSSTQPRRHHVPPHV